MILENLLFSLTGSFCPFGFKIITSTSPFPALKVSTKNFVGASTKFPVGSMPKYNYRIILN